MTEFKVGDKVRVRVSEHTRVELHGLEGNVVQVSELPTQVIYVVVPNHNLIAEGYPSDYWWGFTGWKGYYEVSDRLELISSSSVGVGRLEKPCQVCSRNNDVGVKICWSCGNKPF